MYYNIYKDTDGSLYKAHVGYFAYDTAVRNKDKDSILAEHVGTMKEGSFKLLKQLYNIKKSIINFII